MRFTDLVDRYFVFFPTRELVDDPGAWDVPFEDVSFDAPDGVSLHGWFIPGSDDKTLVWFHGNGGNISHRVDEIVEIHRRIGVNVFIFDYRGYGRSKGSPTEAGTYLDAQGAMQYLRSRRDVDGDKLVLFGRSLGAAVAVEVATKHEVHAVVLQSAFTSAAAMALRHYWFLPGLGNLVRTKYDSLSRIKRVRAPIMIVHGNRDRTVPIDLGRELFDAANPPKRFYEVPGADHNDTYLVGGAAYFDALAAFLHDPTNSER